MPRSSRHRPGQPSGAHQNQGHTLPYAQFRPSTPPQTPQLRLDSMTLPGGLLLFIVPSSEGCSLPQQQRENHMARLLPLVFPSARATYDSPSRNSHIPTPTSSKARNRPLQAHPTAWNAPSEACRPRRRHISGCASASSTAPAPHPAPSAKHHGRVRKLGLSMCVATSCSRERGSRVALIHISRDPSGSVVGSMFWKKQNVYICAPAP